MAVEEKKISGVEKAAILLLSLGEDTASDILKFMGPTEVQKLSSQMTKIDKLTENALMAVVSEFKDTAEASIALGGDEYVKRLLTKALGSDRAKAIIDRVIEGSEGEGLDALKWMEPKVVADLIRNEHPQTISVIISQLEPEHAGHVLSNLPQKTRAGVIMRIASMESVSPDAMNELEVSLKQLLSSGGIAVHSRSIGGVKIAAEILNQLESTNEAAIISDIEKNDNELAVMIQQQMFIFADLVKVDDRGMQSILKEVGSDLLLLALKVSNEDLKEKFFKNMSERARDMLKEDMETRGPVKLSEVEKAQQEIVKVARRLEQEGSIVLGGKGGEDVLV